MDRTQTPPPPPAAAYLYTDRFLGYDYGPYHPLQVSRLSLTHELICQCGLDQNPHEFQEAAFEDLCQFHDRRYLKVLQGASEDPPQNNQFSSHGLGKGDNPVFPGMFQWSSLLAGASLRAAELVSRTGHPVAFNMAGGMHHALAGRASGFCYVNDVVLAISRLKDQGRKVAYIDLDAHHGDGVQTAFFDSDQVLTISLHQHPSTLFPGTGRLEEMGRLAGRGFSVNLPFWPDTDDEIYMRSFDEVVPPLIQAFAPDFIVTQLGVDAFACDPLAKLKLTTTGYVHCLKSIRQMAHGRWIALGGGGYNIVNVARAWTLAWALMLGREDDLPPEMPEDFCAKHRVLADERRFWDPGPLRRGPNWDRAAGQASEAVDFIKENIFPLLQVRS